MTTFDRQDPRRLLMYGPGYLDRLPEIRRLPDERIFEMKVVASVLPFKANNYVVEDLIDWDAVPDDPIFQLTFPQRGMLSDEHFATMARLHRTGAPPAEIKEAANRIRLELNPHPAGQLSHNVPTLDGEPLPGLQHKYRETVLLFPSAGQTCHAYCTFCFRWPQFVGMEDMKFAAREMEPVVRYLRRRPHVTDVLITGGDPMVMKAAVLARYIEPLLEIDSIRDIRIGSKALGYWPHRFVTDEDAGDVLGLFDRVVQSGRHLAFMAHFSHARELDTPVVAEAIRRIRATGAVVRSQSPVLRHINDSTDAWITMWRRQVQLGVIPYYMFVERNTGAKRYFELPLAEALEIFVGAYRSVSGLARTVRGPSMSTLPGKVRIDGVTEIRGERAFMLTFLQARDPDWVRRPFFARFDPDATWLTDLRPAFGEERFFYEDGLDEMLRARDSSAA